MYVNAFYYYNIIILYRLRNSHFIEHIRTNLHSTAMTARFEFFEKGTSAHPGGGIRYFISTNPLGKIYFINTPPGLEQFP